MKSEKRASKDVFITFEFNSKEMTVKNICNLPSVMKFYHLTKNGNQPQRTTLSHAEDDQLCTKCFASEIAIKL